MCGHDMNVCANVLMCLSMELPMFIITILPIVKWTTQEMPMNLNHLRQEWQGKKEQLNC